MLVTRILIASLLLNGGLSAQTPPIPGLPGSPRGGNAAESTSDEGGTPAPLNLAQNLSKPDPEAAFPGEMNFRNLDGFGMAALYQSVTGKRVIVSSTAKDVQFSFVQSAGLKNREVATLIQEYLLMEGFQLNPSLRDPNIVSLLGVNQPGGPASTVRPVRVIDDPALLALETGVVTYVMTFQYLKPEEAQRAFTQVYGQFRPGGTVAEVSNASSLIITEKAELIQSLVRLKEKIDVPSAKVDVAWVGVKYADVQELTEQLNEMFNAQSSQNNSARVQRQGRGNGGATPNTPQIPGLPNKAAGSAGGAASGGGEESPPIITADTRTNRIFLMGRPVDLVFIKELIAAWDIPSDRKNFLNRKLNYLPVHEFVSIVETAISQTLSTASSTNGGGAAGGAGRSSSQANNNQLGNNNNGANAGGGAGGAGGVGGGSGFGSSSLPGSNRPTEPQSILIGRTLVISDNVANSIVVQGPRHHIEIVERLLDELDVRSEQVAIEAVFARYGVTDNLSFGINLAQLLEGNGIGAQTLTGAGFISPDSISSFANLVGGTATSAALQTGLNTQVIAGDFGVFVQALESYTNFKSFARPTVFTTNNKEARISSGRQVAITTESSSVNFSNVTTDFRDVGLELLVRPLVNSGDEVTLEISIIRETVAANSSVTGEDIPDFLSDQLSTTVTVPNGAAVLLGGLIEDDQSSADSGVPLLKHIPGRAELVIMIRPTIIDGQVQLERYQGTFDRGSNISRDTREHFSAPAYVPTRNHSAKKLFNTDKKFAAPQKVAPKKTPTPTAMSPLQKGILDKKKRLAAKKAQEKR